MLIDQDILWSAVMTSIELTLLIVFFSITFDRRQTIWAKTVVTAGYITLYEILHFGFMKYNTYGLIIRLLIRHLLVWITFDVRHKRRLVCHIIYEFIVSAADVVAIACVSLLFYYPPALYGSNEPVEVFAMVISKLLATILVVMLAKDRKLRFAETTVLHWFIIALLPMLFIIVMCIGYLLWLDGLWSAMLTTTILVSSFAAINFLNIKLWVQNWENHKLTLKVCSLDVVKESKDSHTGLRSMYHDMRKHIVYALAELKKGNAEKAQAYLAGRDLELRSYRPRVITGNGVVDNMLVDAETRARKKSVSISCTGSIPEQLRVQDHDLVQLVGNVLDNAVKATARGDVIQAKFVYRDQMLNITVTNPITGRYKKGEGIGMSVIQSITEDSYAGWVDVEKENQSYRISLFIHDMEPRENSACVL